MRKKVAILTKSSKFGGYCVAGIDIDTGAWIRFVSNNDQKHGALSVLDITYRNRLLCKPLDIVMVDVEYATPLAHQPENWLIDSSTYWEKIGEYTLEDVIQLHPAENHSYLYGDMSCYISEEDINNINYSLTLIKVSRLTINQTINTYGKPKTKACFIYNGCYYNNMAVTDSNYYSIQNGYMINHAYLVVSLPNDPFPEDCYYKFVAQIFPVD